MKYFNRYNTFKLLKECIILGDLNNLKDKIILIQGKTICIISADDYFNYQSFIGDKSWDDLKKSAIADIEDNTISTNNSSDDTLQKISGLIKLPIVTKQTPIEVA